MYEIDRLNYAVVMGACRQRKESPEMNACLQESAERGHGPMGEVQRRHRSLSKRAIEPPSEKTEHIKKKEGYGDVP